MWNWKCIRELWADLFTYPILGQTFFAVSLVSKFMHQPKEAHLQAALRIVQYLKGTPGKGILFKRKKSVSLEVYTDADYVGSVVNRRSTTGYCTFLGGNLVTWKSKKQSAIARSSVEAEF